MNTLLPWRSLILALAMLFSKYARADSADKAAAIAAFDEASALMQSGNVRGACGKYQESYTLDAQLGTLLHLGYCEEQLGRLASAWSAFRDAADWARKVDDKRYGVAEEHARMLEPRLSRLQLTIPADLPPNARIQRNGNVISPSVFRSAMPLDLGKYEITVSASGYQTWTGTVELTKEGQVLSLGIPTLQKLSSPLPSSSIADERQVHQPSLGARKWPAVFAGGVALAGGVVWGVFGVQSIQSKADAQRTTGYQQWQLQQSAYDQGTVATVGLLVAGVGALGAVMLWAALPGRSAQKSDAHGASRPLQVQLGLQQVQVSGSF